MDRYDVAAICLVSAFSWTLLSHTAIKLLQRFYLKWPVGAFLAVMMLLFYKSGQPSLVLAALICYAMAFMVVAYLFGSALWLIIKNARRSMREDRLRKEADCAEYFGDIKPKVAPPPKPLSPREF